MENKLLTPDNSSQSKYFLGRAFLVGIWVVIPLWLATFYGAKPLYQSIYPPRQQIGMSFFAPDTDAWVYEGIAYFLSLLIASFISSFCLGYWQSQGPSRVWTGLLNSILIVDISIFVFLMVIGIWTKNFGVAFLGSIAIMQVSLPTSTMGVIGYLVGRVTSLRCSTKIRYTLLAAVLGLCVIGIVSVKTQMILPLGCPQNCANAQLFKADLNRIIFQNADFSGANLSEANLSEVDLSQANLLDANLTRANLNWANLRGADLRGACLKGANLVNATLYEANLSEATYDDNTIWPVGFEPANVQAVFSPK